MIKVYMVFFIIGWVSTISYLIINSIIKNKKETYELVGKEDHYTGSGREYFFIVKNCKTHILKKIKVEEYEYKYCDKLKNFNLKNLK